MPKASVTDVCSEGAPLAPPAPRLFEMIACVSSPHGASAACR